MNHELDPDLEVAFSPSSAIGGNYQPYIERYEELSRTSRIRFPQFLDQSVDPSGVVMDVFVPPEANPGLNPDGCPVVVFIHGGYWQELSRLESSFSAPGFVAQGIALAVPDYALAPVATIDQMIDQCVAAVEHLGAQARTLGINPHRLVLAGSSAGAHLALMVALRRPDLAVAGLVLLSGIYDLRPLVPTSINQPLGLTVESAWGLSPLASDLTSLPPVIVACGEIETAAFIDQQRQLVVALHHARVTVESQVIAQRNHFDIVFDLSDPTSQLGQMVSRMCNRVEP